MRTVQAALRRLGEYHGNEQSAQNWCGQGESDCKYIYLYVIHYVCLLGIQNRVLLECADRVEGTGKYSGGANNLNSSCIESKQTSSVVHWLCESAVDSGLHLGTTCYDSRGRYPL